MGFHFCPLYCAIIQSQIEAVCKQRRDENIKAYFHEVCMCIVLTLSLSLSVIKFIHVQLGCY